MQAGQTVLGAPEAPPTTSAVLEARALTRHYDDLVAVDGLGLAVRPGVAKAECGGFGSIHSARRGAERG